MVYAESKDFRIIVNKDNWEKRFGAPLYYLK